MSLLKSLVVPPLSKHSATVIFLHGLGDSGNGWKPVADMLSPRLPHIKWILPHAEIVPVTANFGMRMPSWFDIPSIPPSLDSAEDEKGLLASAKILTSLVEKEIEEGTSSDRIVIGGFSQGGVVTLLTGLTTQLKLGGLMVLSAWLPLRNKLKSMSAPTASTVPIFWGHGKQDPLVSYRFAEMSKEILVKDFGFLSLEHNKIGQPGLTFMLYPGLEHSTSEDEIGHMKEFLAHVVPNQA